MGGVVMDIYRGKYGTHVRHKEEVSWSSFIVMKLTMMCWKNFRRKIPQKRRD